MRCPKCHSMETKVVDSRTVEDGQTIRRRRECEYCQHRFTTFERKEDTQLMVIKKDGTKEMYDKQKLKKAIILSFAKRKFKADAIDNLITSLEVKRQMDGQEITSKQIGADVVDKLKQIDAVAYVRFASVYKSFDNLEDFKKLIG